MYSRYVKVKQSVGYRVKTRDVTRTTTNAFVGRT